MVNVYNMSGFDDYKKRTPELRIERTIQDELGHLVFIFSANALALLLDSEQVRETRDLSDQFLRTLCHVASSPQLLLAMDRETDESRTIHAIGNIGEADELVPISSKDLGYELFRRLIPEEDERMAQLFDPQYSPVNCNIAVFDDDQSNAPVDGFLSHVVFSVLLKPPSLA